MILFADDDGQVQGFVAALLTKCGRNLIVADDGVAALQKARRNSRALVGCRNTGIELAI